jgi:density-regulated protein DRP1
MADFVELEEVNREVENDEDDVKPSSTAAAAVSMAPLDVVYCPTCSLPPEYCEHGSCFEQCAPWILQNMPEVLSEKYLASIMAKANLGEDEVKDEDVYCSYSYMSQYNNLSKGDESEKKKKKRGGGGGSKKKAQQEEVKVVIAKIQRQKKKYVTNVAGLESVPGKTLMFIYLAQ